MSSNPLLAILLCTSSAAGSNLAWSWPPKPQVSVRLGRPRPANWERKPDISWRAAHDYDQNFSSAPSEVRARAEASLQDYDIWSQEDDYEWRRPGAGESHSHIYTASSNSRPPSGRTSPIKESFGSIRPADSVDSSDYGDILGYSPTFLAELLTPKRALCHQKFELFVDELAFIGHPVHVGMDGTWDFSKPYDGSSATGNAFTDEDKNRRGRTLGRQLAEGSPFRSDISLSPDTPRTDKGAPNPHTSGRHKRTSNALSSFHLVLVLDRPDPSSVASSDLYRFIDVYYRQLAFKLTAAMHYEQGRMNFVAQEAYTLISMKESCASQGASFQTYVDRSLKSSSLASAIRTVYDNISCGDIAHININEISVHVQLPPSHIRFLRGEVDSNEDEVEALDDTTLDTAELDEQDAQGRYEDEIQYGWRLPPLLPWKTLLLMDMDDSLERISHTNSHIDSQDEKNAEDLLRKFIALVASAESENLPLSDMAALLDLDLSREIYPMARNLIYHRKAKVIDVINKWLKNVYAPPPELPEKYTEYCTLFSRTFPAPVPSLPALLSAISSSHRPFASIVPSPDHQELYHSVLIWLLKRDLLVMLHIRVRIVATEVIKSRVRQARRREYEEKRAKRLEDHKATEQASEPLLAVGSGYDSDDDRVHAEPNNGAGNGDDGYQNGDEPDVHEGEGHLENSVGATTNLYGEYSTNLRSPSYRSPPSPFGNIPIPQSTRQHTRKGLGGLPRGDDESSEHREMEESDWSDSDDDLTASLIPDPARATPLERKWLEAMVEGRSESVKWKWQRTYIYFDGKKTADEICYRADLRRKHLREVLHQFEEFLIVFLHP